MQCNSSEVDRHDLSVLLLMIVRVTARSLVLHSSDSKTERATSMGSLMVIIIDARDSSQGILQQYHQGCCGGHQEGCSTCSLRVAEHESLRRLNEGIEGRQVPSPVETLAPACHPDQEWSCTRVIKCVATQPSNHVACINVHDKCDIKL